MIISLLAAAVICGPNVSTHPDGRDGIDVYVSAPGPDVVTVDVLGREGYHYRLTQQITRHGVGAEFDFGETAPVSQIVVSSKALGVCEVDK